MKQTSMRLISQNDDKDTETMEKVVLFLTGIVQNKQKPKRELTLEQARKVALVDKYCGAFAASQTEDWKKNKGRISTGKIWTEVTCGYLSTPTYFSTIYKSEA